MLIERYGPDQNTVDLLALVSADCPGRQANQVIDLCGRIYADLGPK